MLYHAITKDDLKNGIGIRLVLWVAGCEHKCKGCHNAFTWDETLGQPFDLWEEAEILEYLKKDYVSGITFSGGDPLHPNNRKCIGELAKKCAAIPDKDIWLYTGYSLNVENGQFVFSDDVMNLPRFTIDWLNCLDVVVDGRFNEEIRKADIYKSKDPHWRGSSNQKLIDVKESIKQSAILEITDTEEKKKGA